MQYLTNGLIWAALAAIIDAGQTYFVQHGNLVAVITKLVIALGALFAGHQQVQTKAALQSKGLWK